MREQFVQDRRKDADRARSTKGRCLFHPAMKCPTLDEPCIFKLIEKMQRERAKNSR